MALRYRFLAAAALAALAACQSPSAGYRSDEIDPDLRLLALMDVYRGVEPPEPEPGEESEGAWRPIDRGHVIVDAQRARVEIERLSLEFPRHVPTLFANASICFEHGEPERAGAYLDRLFFVQRAHPEAGVLRSRIAIQDGNLRLARRVLEEQVRYQPDHSGLRESLGAVLFLRGEPNEARLQLEMARRLGAPSWRVEFNLGLIDETAGHGEAAAAHYERALFEQPDCREAASRLAGLRAAAGEVVR